MTETANTLHKKLDDFIRKYYHNQLIKGTLYSFSAILAYFVIANVLEYFGQLGSFSRGILFYGFILCTLSFLGVYIAIPLLAIRKIGNCISYEKAADIIGKYFKEIEDKLLNTLQLSQQSIENKKNTFLIQASIQQKTKELNPFPFTSAVDFKENKKYLKYFIPPLLIFLLIVLFAPGILSDGTNRLINYNTYFEPIAPFSFEIKNNKLEVVEQKDFNLLVGLKGTTLPKNLFIEIGDTRFKLSKDNNISFSYLFKNVDTNIDFKLYGDDYFSQTYHLQIIPNPTVLNFKLRLHYPKYLQMQDVAVGNNGNIVVPEGTKISWEFQTKNTNELQLLFNDTSYTLKQQNSNDFKFIKTVVNNERYTVVTANQFVRNSDSMEYQIQVIKDKFPSIRASEKVDSISLQRRYYTGEIKDDYGFSKLTFNYRFIDIADSSNRKGELNTVQIPLNKGSIQTPFYFFWDMVKLQMLEGEKIQYYFQVWDNDGVNGSKSARTPIKVFKVPSAKELSIHADKQNEKLKDDMDNAIKEASKLKKDWNKEMENLFQKSEMNWQDKQKIQSLLDRQNELKNQTEQLIKQNQINNFQQSEFSKKDEEMINKQEELKKLFDDIMTDEMKKLLQDIQKMLDEMNMDALKEDMKDMELSNKDLEKELDRTLEIFKQMELDQKIKETVDKLNNLSEEQKELSEQTEQKNIDKEEIIKKENDLKNEFEDIQKDIEKIDEKNEALETPRELPDMDEKEKSVENNMNNSMEELNKKHNKKSSEQQKKAADEMQQMADDMESMMNASANMQQQEDMDALRQLLENLISLSFDQEKIMNGLKELQTSDPKYVELGQEQKKLKDQAAIIEDSLFALSKRVIQIQSLVNREITLVNNNMNTAIDNLSDRLTSSAIGRQQYVMTSVNNLALMLDEALQQMQKQQAQKMPGSGMCQKPGGNNSQPSTIPSMQQLQQQLSKQLQDLKDGIEKNKGKNGKNNGGEKGSNPFGKNGEFLNKQLAKAAAKQAQIREQLEKMGEEMNRDGSGFGNQLKEIAKQMEEIEKDIVNKNINTETLKRQQYILTRLLESDKAQREREFKDERKSFEAKDELFSNPNQYFKYNKEKEKEFELLKTVPPTLKPYYKSKVNEYFSTFE